MAFSPAVHGGEPLSVTDSKGRTISIELVSLAGESVVFRKEGDPKEFTVPILQFDGASRDLIRKHAAALPAVIPKIQTDVVIGKRRKDKDGSYYMVRQEVTCSIKLTNLSKTLRVPPIKGKIVFIGQNSKTPDLFKILSTQAFEASMNTGETVLREMESFSTSYDSDNKGQGNLGGYQYFGYVLALLDSEGKVLQDQSTTGSFRLALTENPGLLKKILAYPNGTTMDGKLVGPDVAGE